LVRRLLYSPAWRTGIPILSGSQTRPCPPQPRKCYELPPARRTHTFLRRLLSVSTDAFETGRDRAKARSLIAFW